MLKLARPTTLVTLAISLAFTCGMIQVSADEVAPASGFGQIVSNLNPANWKMPKMPRFQALMPQTEEKARIKKKKDGLVNEVGKTASSSWNRTKNALNPTKFFTASSRTPAKSEPVARKPSFFQSLFSPSIPKDENASMSGFLKQERPAP